MDKKEGQTNLIVAGTRPVWPVEIQLFFDLFWHKCGVDLKKLGQTFPVVKWMSWTLKTNRQRATKQELFALSLMLQFKEVQLFFVKRIATDDWEALMDKELHKSSRVVKKKDTFSNSLLR